MQAFTFLDLNKNELRNAKIQNLGSDPSGLTQADEGRIWYNTGTHKFMIAVYDGTSATTAHALNVLDSVTGTAPISASITNGVLTVSIAPASGASAGSLSAAGYTLLNGATSNNTASTLVLRDASGNFTAGTITATLTGTASNAALLNNQAGSYYLARANQTGTQTASTISDFATTVQATRLDQFAAPTSAVAFNGQRITGLADPTSAQDAATKNYVDSVASGFDVKASVRVASTANVTISTGLVTGATIDGIVVATGDRVLLKNQTTATENGIYLVVAAGAGTRASDFSTNSGSAPTAANPGSFVFVEQGTANGATAWVMVTQGPITLGTTALAWSQVGSSAGYTAGNGLNLAGQTLSVVGTANRISVSAGGVDIAASYVGQTSITTLGTISSGTWQGTAVGVAYGGTGATTAAGARTALGATAKAVVTLTGTGALTSFSAAHNLNSINHTAQVFDSSNNLVLTDVVAAANTDTITISPAPANGATFTFVAVG
jgi:hypothetical protein